MRNVKVTTALFLLLFLDVIRPFGHTLNVEFLLLGIAYISLSTSLFFAIGLSIVLGYCKDAFSLSGYSLSVIEFPLICLATKFLLPFFRFSRKQTQKIILNSVSILIALLIHILFNTVRSGLLVVHFYIQFLIQSFLLSFFLNFLLERWVLPHALIENR